jgi:hypothetical protein
MARSIVAPEHGSNEVEDVGQGARERLTRPRGDQVWEEEGIGKILSAGCL